jgi:predicted enzyme related to lactoylglutathione lyase
MKMAEKSLIVSNIHHEILVDDVSAAEEFFEEVFGATRVEHEFAEVIEQGWELKNRHMWLNGRIYQLLSPNEPVSGTSGPLKNWYDRSVQPGIHNVTFGVSDTEALAAKLRAYGVASMGEMVPFPGAKVYMYDATKQCGMRFEFVDAAGYTFPDTSDIAPSPVVLANVHLEMLCDDPAGAEKFFVEVFGAERTEVGFAREIEETFELTNRHVQMNGEIYQFIRPNDKVSWPLMNWYDRSVSPGIHNVTFVVADAEGLARTLREKGCRCMGEMRAVAPNMVTPTTVYMYDATKQCGMRFEFIQG